jgi:hypothetical protein
MTASLSALRSAAFALAAATALSLAYPSFGHAEETAPVPAPSPEEAPASAPAEEASPTADAISKADKLKAAIRNLRDGLTEQRAESDVPAEEESALPDDGDEETAAGKQAPSLMLSDNEQDWIRKAIKAYRTKIPVGVLLPNLFPSDIYGKADTQSIPPPEPIKEPDAVAVESAPIEEALPIRADPVVPEAISFNSFLRVGTEGWLAWVNGKKVASGEEFAVGNVTIRKMSGGRLFFLWKDSELDRILPTWKDDMRRIGETDFHTNGKNVIVDRFTLNVGFYLNPGESFNGASLRVYSGDDAPPPAPLPSLAADALPGGGKALSLKGGKEAESAITAEDMAALMQGDELRRRAALPEYLTRKDMNSLLALYNVMVE